MPPRIAFDREKILNTALEILKNDGEEALTARSIAARMGGSTRPIYREFASIEELDRAVLPLAASFATETILEAGKSEEPFLGIGIGYLAFAREYPGLFRYLFLSGGIRLSREMPGDQMQQFLVRMKRDPHLKGIPEERLSQLLADMWTFTQGLNSMAPSIAPDEREQYFRERLEEIGGTLIIWERLRLEQPEMLRSLLARMESEKKENIQ